MPELPEVQTTAMGLNGIIKRIIPRPRIIDVWTDYKSQYFKGSKTIKDPVYFSYFKRKIKGKTIIHVTRRAKNVLIHLSDNLTILVHMKMTGHLLYGNYDKSDPYNRFIHLVFHLSNGKKLELSDMRKFAKVALVKTAELHLSEHLKDIGPEPLEKSFTFAKFKERIFLKSGKKIKPTLTDQSVIAGIGNIYADESLWLSLIHPEEIVEKIPIKKLQRLYDSIKILLKKGIDFGGDSMSDYRNIHGERGRFQEQHRVYQKTGEKCSKKGIDGKKCSGFIVRIVVAGRGTHFCNVHQKKSFI